MYLIIFAFQSPLKCIHLPCRVHNSSTRTNTSKTTHPTKKKWNVQPLTTNPTLTSHHAPDWDRGNFFLFLHCLLSCSPVSLPSKSKARRQTALSFPLGMLSNGGSSSPLYSKLLLGPHSPAGCLSQVIPLGPRKCSSTPFAPNLNKAGLFVTQDTSELHMLNSRSLEGPVTRLSIEVTDLLRHLFSSLFS